MILTLLTIICFIIFIIWNIKKYKNWGEFDFTEMFCILFIMFVIWIFLCFLYFAFEKPIDTKVIKKQEIYSIKDSQSLNGSWTLFGGSIEEVDYYFFWIETENGKYKQKLEQDKSYIIEENIEQPYYEKIEQICRNIDGLETGCMYKNNYYIFHIPKGSIKYDYDLQ